ncbi:MAG: o-succinylbenzoate synthase [Deltaproteobacteria bacterium]|nr:o-succinylbenzoate synthase [Deltaproteobacteria bacterium]
MKLDAIELAAFRLPLARAVQTGAGTHVTREGFVIRIRDDQGRVGHGEATPLVSQGTESLESCEAALVALGRRLLGLELSGASQLAELLPGEDTPAARCGLELALLDLLALEQRAPVASLLTTDALSRVAVNALLVEDHAEALAREAALRVAEGFSTLKLKVGARPLDEDLARVRAVANAAGARALLRLDANGAWPLPLARRALEAMSEIAELELCEQPVASLEDLGQLTSISPVPVAADELLARPEIAETLIHRRAAHAVVLKPMVLGGLLPAQRLAVRAARAGLEVIVTTTLDGVLARAGAWHLASALPGPLPACGLATGFTLAEDLGSDPMILERGRARVPTLPGLGVQPTRDLAWRDVA